MKAYIPEGMYAFVANMKNIVEVLKNQIKYYPELEIQDVLKAVYQSVFGCGHFVYDEDKCRELLLAEMASLEIKDGISVEELGEYSRVHLWALDDLGISPEMLLRLFILSARKEEREEKYIEILNSLPLLCDNGSLPFEGDEMKRAVELHIAEGCPSLHHSEYFRKKYHPAYRVIKREYAELIPLIAEAQRLLKKKRAPIIAIDGNCASGKSTLAICLAEIFKADVVHMDDYFLPFDRRTRERMSELGGNIDRERFLEEFLLPLSEGDEYISRPYRCHGGYYEEPKTKKPHGLTIVEGSYSLHPELEGFYDLKIFMCCDSKEQIARLEHRNPEMLDRFVSIWIPREDRYFEGTDIDKRCDIIIKNDKFFNYKVKPRA